METCLSFFDAEFDDCGSVASEILRNVRRRAPHLPENVAVESRAGSVTFWNALVLTMENHLAVTASSREPFRDMAIGRFKRRRIVLDVFLWTGWTRARILQVLYDEIIHGGAE